MNDAWGKLYTMWLDLQKRQRQGRRCRHCMHWHLKSWDEELALASKTQSVHPDDVRGECRRHAPRPTELRLNHIALMCEKIAWATETTADIEQPQEELYSRSEMTAMDEINEWPTTLSSEWCGDFKPGRVKLSTEEIERLEALNNAFQLEQEEKARKPD